jgi:hypothetical protein
MQKKIEDLFIFTIVLFSIVSVQVFAQGTYTDREGYMWDFGPDGSVNDGDNDTFDGGLQLIVNGQRVGQQGGRRLIRAQQIQNQAGLSDGKSGTAANFGPFQAGEVQVTRKVLIPKDIACVRYLEIFENTSNNQVEINISIFTDLGNASGQVIGTNDGGGMSYAVAPQEDGQRNSVGFRIADDRNKKFRADITANGDNVVVNLSQPLRLAPKGKVAVLHVVAQRRTAASAMEFLKSLQLKRFVKDLDPEDRKILINVSGGAGVFLLGNIQLFRGERGDTVQLKTGEILVGTLPTAQIPIKTEFGDFVLNSTEILSMFSEKSGEKNVLVILQSGEVLSGFLGGEKLTLKMPDGFEAAIPIGLIDKYGKKIPELYADANHATSLKTIHSESKSEENEGKSKTSATKKEKTVVAEQFVFEDPIFVLRGGERLVGKTIHPTFGIRSAFGELAIKTSDIKLISFSNKNQSVNILELRDGSKIKCFLLSPSISIQLRLGGKITLDMSRFTEIHFTPNEVYLSAIQKADEEAVEPNPQNSDNFGTLNLVNGDTIFCLPKGNNGKLLVDTPFGASREIIVNEIKMLMFDSRSYRKTKIVIWDGSSFPVNLKGDSMSFQTKMDMEVKIPLGLISNFKRPLASPPQDVCATINDLVKKLGDADPTQRNTTQEKLIKMGQGVKSVLISHWEHEDLEIRTRVRNIVKALSAEYLTDEENEETEEEN